MLGQAKFFYANSEGRDNLRKACQLNPNSYAAAIANASAGFDETLSSGQPSSIKPISLVPQTPEDFLFETLYQAWIHPRAAVDALEQAEGYCDNDRLSIQVTFSVYNQPDVP